MNRKGRLNHCSCTLFPLVLCYVIIPDFDFMPVVKVQCPISCFHYVLFGGEGEFNNLNAIAMKLLLTLRYPSGMLSENRGVKHFVCNLF